MICIRASGQIVFLNESHIDIFSLLKHVFFNVTPGKFSVDVFRYGYINI